MDRNSLLNDPETAMRVALAGNQAGIWTSFPAIVTSVNLEQMTLEAQPAIKGLQQMADGTERYVNLPLLVDVPICFPSGGGFTMTFPIAVNDEVLISIASRCIDSWWQNGGLGIPMESRMHDLSDGFAMLGPKSLPNVIEDISDTNVQLRNDAGTCYLEITPSGSINLKAPSGVNITGSLVVSGDVTAGTVSLKTHVHSGVTPGGGSSGPPV